MASRFAGSRLWVVLAAALVVALVSLFALVQGGESARASDEQSKIIGGTAVPDGKYRFVAAVLDTRNGNTTFQQQFCGGTLIDRDSVLTAAHCVKGEPARPLRVVVGRTVLDSKQGQLRRVGRISIHPRYNGRTSVYDAAVLKLSSPVSGITPIKLATSGQNSLEAAGRSATVAGWGNTISQPVGGDNGSNYPQRMREAPVPLVSDANARQFYGNNFVSPIMVAAGRTGKDTCQGDSGGPMFTRASGRYTQIGITSFGAGCGAPGAPGVYAEVNSPSIRNFITNAANK